MTCQGDAYANEGIANLCVLARGKHIMKYRWENQSTEKKKERKKKKKRKETGFWLGHAKDENSCSDAWNSYKRRPW